MGCLLWINWLIWILQINSYKGIQKRIHDIISGDEFRSCMLYAIACYTGCCFYGAWLYRSCNWPPLSGVYQNISMSYTNGQNTVHLVMSRDWAGWHWSHDDVINGSIYRVTGPFWRGNHRSHRLISFTKAIDAELWYFLWSVPKQTVE